MLHCHLAQRFVKNALRDSLILQQAFIQLQWSHSLDYKLLLWCDFDWSSCLLACHFHGIFIWAANGIALLLSSGRKTYFLFPWGSIFMVFKMDVSYRENLRNSDTLKNCCNCPTVMILSLWTNMPRQTVQTEIRLLLEEQSDQGLHCLPFRLSLLDSLLYGRAT